MDRQNSVQGLLQPLLYHHFHTFVVQELDKQVEEGKLEKVDSKMGSTPWISNPVLVPIGVKKHDNNPPDLFDIRHVTPGQ
ncbi:hypothetical protein BpHYR1_054434 [Brachionus plicatilis]|uniref:Uncharacterized protein n=1 Tax=Brachionus plicatilis TaxID=10195 RepID=A0A3M7SJ42_BRAPC|nr:hypothetical protein BpHYR1_054434 [Brachionus plicatilis]